MSTSSPPCLRSGLSLVGATGPDRARRRGGGPARSPPRAIGSGNVPRWPAPHSRCSPALHVPRGPGSPVGTGSLPGVVGALRAHADAGGRRDLAPLRARARPSGSCRSIGPMRWCTQCRQRRCRRQPLDAAPDRGGRRGGRLGSTAAAVLVGSLPAVLGINAARNYAASGEVVVIASHGGLNLYIGNHERADGTYTPVAGITPSIAGQASDSTRVAGCRGGRRAPPLARGSLQLLRVAGDSRGPTGHPADAAAPRGFGRPRSCSTRRCPTQLQPSFLRA